MNFNLDIVNSVIELADKCYPTPKPEGTFATGDVIPVEPAKEYRELHSYIAGLSEKDQNDLVILMLIGRDDLIPEDLEEKNISERFDAGTPGYLADKMYLADYLRAGLEKIQAEQ